MIGFSANRRSVNFAGVLITTVFDMKFLILFVAAFWLQCLAFELRILSPNEHSQFGAEILGLDVETIDDKSFDAVHDALLRYKVLVVRNQRDLSVEGQRKFTKRFGHLHVHLESSSHLPGYQDVNVVSNIKNSTTGKYIGLYGAHVENFHSDLSW
jgi:alpha-ketoglutarate-dependent taurine dioxygenase